MNFIVEKIMKSFQKIGIEVEEKDFDESKYADLACKIAFKLAKEKNENPIKIANEIVNKIEKPTFIEKIESKNGYINFFFNYQEIAKHFLKKVIEKEKYCKKNGKKKVVIDYSCPNPGKPMHIGHIRSTIIGDCLARVFEYLGYKVVRSNYMNDRGLHIGKLMAAIELWGLPELEKIKEPEKLLFKLYVKFNKESEKDEKLLEKAREWVKKIDEKDKKALDLLNRVFKISWKGFEEIYDLLNVKFDEVIRETEIVEMGKEMVRKALKKGIAFKAEEGQIVANLEKYGLPNTVILRSDGTALYITSDLGLAVYRYNKHKFDEMLYVVASEQKTHFKQLFKILELLGYEWVKNCKHIPFGLIFLPEGKISTREGRVIFLKDVLMKAIELAKKEVEKRNFVKEKIDENARKIGIACVKYAILSVENEKDINFEWNRILNFDGKTGAYLLYSYVRAKSILEKFSGSISFETEKIDESEKRLIKQLIKFEKVVEEVKETFQPYILANYLFDLAKSFTDFYHSCKVLGSEKESFRIALVKAFSIIMKIGLNLLGIETIEKM